MEGGITVNTASQPAATIIADDPVATLQKLKVLLDSDIITQQEFDAKKLEVISKM